MRSIRGSTMNTTPLRPHRRFDWSEIYARLDRAAEATRHSLGPTPEQAKALMDERARALARVPIRSPEPSEILEVAAFTLAGERYAIETRYVTKVLRLTDFTPVPGTPEFLGGVLNLRGEILALIDLRSFFGIPSVGLTDLSRIIVLGLERNEFGIMADDVQEVLTLPVHEVLEAPASLPGGGGRAPLIGVTADARIVLDGSALLDDPNLFIDQSDEPTHGFGS
ncbi:chemotaxis protein CheW [Tundrisphaera lichenicola]|uniref:chemotaxis protein CheW n=1 Tax=Tundrisphaera lichenicola TaxID=2029860 RepID=UPI003EBB49D6